MTLPVMLAVFPSHQSREYTNQNTTQVILCYTNYPGIKIIEKPTYQNDVIACSTNTKDLSP
jgi:hypothetical protein